MSISLQIKRAFSGSLFIFYALSMVTSFLNFLYYPLTARLLPPSQYGEVQFLVSMLFQVSVIFMALNIITIILSVRYENSELASKKIAALASTINNITIILTVCGVALLAYIGTDLFKFSSIWPFFALGSAALSTVPFTIAIGRLQGKGLYVDAGILSAGGSLLKLILSIIFVMSGLGTTGALLGIALGQLVGTIIAVILGSVTKREVFNLVMNSYTVLKEDRRLILLAGTCIVIANLLSIFDVAYAKLSLTPYEAGLYAGIATLAKIALYIVSPLMWIAIPLAVAPEKNHKRIATLTAAAFMLCVGLLLFYALFGRWFAHITLGPSYPIELSILLLATFSMAALAIATFMNALLAAASEYRRLVTQTVLMIFGVIGVVVYFVGQQTITTILLSLLASGSTGILYYTITHLLKNRRLMVQ